MALADRGAAVPILSEATDVALAAHDDALAIEAWARRAWALGTTTDPAGAFAGLDVIDALANRTAGATFARALLYNNLGSVELARDHRDEARGYFQRSLAVARSIAGRGALELVAVRINLALVTDEHARGDALLADAASELADRLDPEHPDALDAQRLRSFMTIDNLHDAERLLVPVCGAFELHPGFAQVVAECWTEVGLLRLDIGDRSGATIAMAQAARTPGVDPVSTVAVPYLALLRGQPRDAAQQLAAALAAVPVTRDAKPWVRLERGALGVALGRADRELGDLRAARRALEAAIGDLEPAVRLHPGAIWERRLGRARVELAFTLAGLGASEPERTAAATTAAAWLRDVGGSPAELAELGVR
jgi:tetratricopeptide (TPR) repeat protein